jgi:hypothetical protein
MATWDHLKLAVPIAAALSIFPYFHSAAQTRSFTESLKPFMFRWIQLVVFFSPLIGAFFRRYP